MLVFSLLFTLIYLNPVFTKVLTYEDYAGLYTPSVETSLPNSTQLLIKATRFNGQKETTDLFFKDTSTPIPLRLKKWTSLFMLSDNDLVVLKKDENGRNQLYHGILNSTSKELNQVTNFKFRIYDVTFNARTKMVYYRVSKKFNGSSTAITRQYVYHESGVRSLNGFARPVTRYTHIWTSSYTLEEGKLVIKDQKDLFSDMTKFFNVVRYSVSENGKWIAFVAPGNRLQTARSLRMINNLFLVPTNLTQQPFKISDTAIGEQVNTFVFSPSGKSLFWNVLEEKNYQIPIKSTLYNIKHRSKKDVLGGFDRAVEQALLLSDRTLAFTAIDDNARKLYTCDLDSGEVTERTGSDQSVTIERMLDRTRIVIKTSHLLYPPELSIMNTENWATTKITDFNADAMSQIEMSNVKKVKFKGWNNETVTGWLHKPAGFDASKKYPSVLWNHAGPTSVALINEWIVGSAFNPNLYASQGYFVLGINFHGSPGYGRAFMESIYGEFGGAPYEDVVAGLNYALKKNPQMDPNRVCSFGKSYGGYMTLWLSGKNPDRFACFAAHAAIFDLNLAYLTSGYPKYYYEHMLKSTDPATPDAIDVTKFSPSSVVANFSKPTLLTHSKDDYIVSIDQSIEAFESLQSLNVTSKLVVFPNASHVISNPFDVKDQFQYYIDWFNQYTKEVPDS